MQVEDVQQGFARKTKDGEAMMLQRTYASDAKQGIAVEEAIGRCKLLVCVVMGRILYAGRLRSRRLAPTQLRS